MSSVQREQFIIPTGIIWEIKTVATQPVGVPATMGYTITIPEGERGLLIGGVLGPDNYGAGRGVNSFYRLPGGAVTVYKLGSDTVDNAVFGQAPQWFSITETSYTSDVVGLPFMPYIMPELAVIRVTGASLINTETLSGTFWIATRVLPPITAAIGASVTLTTNTILQV